MNSAAIGCDDGIRQLALCRKPTRDVLVVGGHGAKLLTGTLMWVEHNYGLPRALLEIVERRDEISVAGDKYDAIKVPLHVVDEHLGCDVYVGTLLFGLPYGCDGNLIAGFARLLGERVAGSEALVVALDDAQFGAIRRKSGKIRCLSHLGGRLRWIIVDAGREVFDSKNVMFVGAGQQSVRKCDDIKPLVLRIAEQPVIQVESVDINYGFLFHLLIRQEPGACPALHRIAEAQRSVSNPSRGSARIVSNFRPQCKEVNSVSG